MSCGVIPSTCWQEVLHELHLAHPWICRMKCLARSYVWWPAIYKEQKEMVPNCDTCQLHNMLPPAAPLYPWEWPEKPRTRILIDYACPFLSKMLLVTVAATSKWIETLIMNSATSTATICKLRQIFAQHGLPVILVSDNAPNFTSEEFETVTRKIGIVHITPAPFHPASNSLADRMSHQHGKQIISWTEWDCWRPTE